MPRPSPHPNRLTWAVVALTALALVVNFVIKAQCTGAPFDELGRSLGYASTPGRICYSDLTYLWSGRDLYEHVFPYLSGWIDDGGRLHDGAVEYPVLSGLLMWLGSLGAHTDRQYLAQMAMLLAPFGLAIGALLTRLTGRAALLWPLAPPLALYAFHNMELPVVFTSVAAIAVVVFAERRGTGIRAAALGAAVLLGLGLALKLYPAIFALPLALYVLTRGRAGRAGVHRRGLDVLGALATAAVTAGVALAVNLPFMMLGWDGWRAALKFQELRTADLSTNSIWFWGVRDLFANAADYDTLVAWLSPLLILCGFAVAVGLGLWRYRRTGVFPWIAVSAGMLCAFMLLHKVNSPQYMLWLLPFFVVLKLDWRLIAAYLAFDLSLELSVWPYLQQHADGDGINAWVQAGMWVGVWGRAALLAVFLILLPLCRLRREPGGASSPSGGPAGPAPSDYETGAGAGTRPTVFEPDGDPNRSRSAAPSSTPPCGSSRGAENGPGQV